MSEYRVEIVTGHKKVYYIEAEDYEKAEELATSGKLKPSLPRSICLKQKSPAGAGLSFE